MNFNNYRDASLHQRYGHYQSSVHADKIYGTRKNRAYCKKLGIRLSGPRLGRPRKVTKENKEELKLEKKQLQKDKIDRIPVEEKFGQGKRRFGLGLIKSKLATTTKSAIHITFIVMNLEKWLKAIFSTLFLYCGKVLADLLALILTIAAYHGSKVMSFS